MCKCAWAESQGKRTVAVSFEGCQSSWRGLLLKHKVQFTHASEESLDQAAYYGFLSTLSMGSLKCQGEMVVACELRCLWSQHSISDPGSELWLLCFWTKFLLIYLEGSRSWSKYLDTCHSYERWGWSFAFSTFTWPSPHCCVHLGKEEVDRRSFSVSLFPSFSSSFCMSFLCHSVVQLNKYIFWENVKGIPGSLAKSWIISLVQLPPNRDLVVKKPSYIT